MSGNSNSFKQQINSYMTKLSDRSTEQIAISGLESIAKSLTAENFPPFVAAISDTRAADRPSLRRHSLRLLSLLATCNRHSASHVPRMLNAALKRIRDPDTCVRHAFVDACRSLVKANAASTVTLISKPLYEALTHEQDANAQASAALSLSAVLMAASGLDPELKIHVRKIVPKLIKLVKSNAFKAKSALVEVIGVAAGKAGLISDDSLIEMAVSCLLGCLKTEDWTVRKAAAEALSTVGLTQRETLGKHKQNCILLFQSQRFDKVKIVRESMNRMIQVWKDIPDVNLEDSELPASDSHINSSQKEKKNRISVSRSPPPSAPPNLSIKKKKFPDMERKSYPPSSHKTNIKECSKWREGTEMSNTPPPDAVTEEKNARNKFEAKRLHFENKLENKSSRVVPCEEPESLQVMAVVENAKDENQRENKDTDLSLIRNQLLQIEKQQSGLLDLLQKFMGSSQNGIHSLETRVHSIELTLDEISRDLAISSRRLSTSDPAVKTCCSLLGAEFLSPKYWRRTDGGRYSMSGNTEVSGMRFLADQRGEEHCKQKLRIQNSFVINPLAEINSQSIANSEITPNRNC